MWAALAVLAVDACVSNGLEVPEFSTELQRRIAELCPRNGGVSNPIDLGAEASAPMYEQVLDLLLSCGEIDAVAVNFTPPLVTRRTDDVAAAIVAAVDRAAARADATSLDEHPAGGPARRGEPAWSRRERPDHPSVRTQPCPELHLPRDRCAGARSLAPLWRVARATGGDGAGPGRY